jgi:hypothetical protein
VNRPLGIDPHWRCRPLAVRLSGPVSCISRTGRRLVHFDGDLDRPVRQLSRRQVAEPPDAGVEPEVGHAGLAGGRLLTAQFGRQVAHRDDLRRSTGHQLRLSAAHVFRRPPDPGGPQRRVG